MNASRRHSRSILYVLPKKGGHATSVFEHRDDSMRSTKLLKCIHYNVYNMVMDTPSACDAKFATAAPNLGVVLTR